MEIKLNVNDVVLAINKMSDKEKILLCQALCKDDVIMQEINRTIVEGYNAWKRKP